MKHSDHFNVHVHLLDLVIPNYIVLYSVFNSKMKKENIFLPKCGFESFVLMIWGACGPFKILYLMFSAFDNIQKWSIVRPVMQHIHNAKYFGMGQLEKCYASNIMNKPEEKREKIHTSCLFINGIACEKRRKKGKEYTTMANFSAYVWIIYAKLFSWFCFQRLFTFRWILESKQI